MFRDNLVYLRGVNGFTQEQIAEKLGISRQAYAKWERGDTVPDIGKVMRLAGIYGTTVDSLVGEGEVREDVGFVPPAPKGKHMWGTVTIDERGNIALPKEAMENFGIGPGSRLILLSDDAEGFALVPSDFFEKRMQDVLSYASRTANE